MDEVLAASSVQKVALQAAVPERDSPELSRNCSTAGGCGHCSCILAKYHHWDF